MRRHTAPLFLLVALALAPAAALAQDANKPAATPLPAWDQLTPAQRELLIAPVRDRWNREPEKRARFMEYAERWKSMPPPQRERARHGMQRWEGMTPEQREQARALFQQKRGMSSEQRKELRDRWHGMTPEQRRQWATANPPPPGIDPR